MIVGRTECGKTFYTETSNDFFGKLRKGEWVSYIILMTEREAEIESCFQCETEFHYLQRSGWIIRFNGRMQK